jgi:2,3-diaminopropionate biosynthesis protein SbnB
VLDAVRDAYVLHGEGQSQLPFSSFLRPPESPGSRIISLPAYLGGPDPLIGIKWISSFPHNVELGLQRASSVMVLNDLVHGYPRAMLEASQVSAWRTAASAALAGRCLAGDGEVHTAGLIGCGTINERVLGFLTRVHPELRRVLLHDALPEHVKAFAERVQARHPQLAVEVVDLDGLLLLAQTVSIATTDSTYWLDLGAHPGRPAEQVVLHLSLRDLSTGSILRAYNVVDDVDHVCREHTSLHRAEQELGHRAFIHATIGELLGGRTTLARPEHATTVFSPFGLGVLDLAVAAVVLDAADQAGLGLSVDGFDPGRHLAAATSEVSHA